MEGWIKLHRKIKDHWLWKSDHRLKWWLDILLTVNHADTKILIKGNLIECKRGQSVRSLETWARDWNVTKKTVKEFFELLQNDSMLVYEGIKISTRITVCNYDDYQDAVNIEKSKGKRKVNGEETVPAPKQEGIRMIKKFVEADVNDSFNFYLDQATKAKEYPSNPMAKAYVELCRHICKKDKDGSYDMYFVLNIQKQISLDQFSALYDRSGKNPDAIMSKIDSIQSKVNYHNTYTDLFKTINSWFINDTKRFK